MEAPVTEMQKKDERLFQPGEVQPIVDTKKAHLGDKPGPAGAKHEAGEEASKDVPPKPRSAPTS
jgi:hypothetical protein